MDSKSCYIYGTVWVCLCLKTIATDDKALTFQVLLCLVCC
jgi:hypothetical protein